MATKVIVQKEMDLDRLSGDLCSAVNEVKNIQVLVASFIDAIIVRKNDEIQKEMQVIKDTMTHIHKIRCKLDELGKRYTQLTKIDEVPLGNTGYLSLEPAEEHAGFYERLLECYSWVKNLDDQCSNAWGSLKRKNNIADELSPKKHKPTSGSLLDLLNDEVKGFPQLTFNLRSVQSENYITIQVSNQLNLWLFLTGFKPTDVIVCSAEESYTSEKMQPSKYTVFTQLTEVFQTVLLILHNEKPALILRKFFAYVSGYTEMFSSKCEVCKKHLNMDSTSLQLVPPVKKDLDKALFYHLSCK